MTYVTYQGIRSRDPRLALRVVNERGVAFHVLAFSDDEEASDVARRVSGSVHEDRDQAIREALTRAGPQDLESRPRSGDL